MTSELRELSERWFRAWLESDDTMVERLAAEDYSYVAPSGQVMDREAILKVIRSPSYRLDHGSRTEVVVRPLGREAADLLNTSLVSSSRQKASRLRSSAIDCCSAIDHM
jgi:hypothetical protein